MKNKKISIPINFIFIYFIMILSGTYAYLYINEDNNQTVGTAGCFEVDYTKGQEISASNLSVTTNYEEGAKTTISISKTSNCKIYTYSNIYIHTNDTTTSPITETKALKYKITKDNNWEYNGTIEQKGDFLLATVPITEDPIEYTIYFWVDSNISNGTYDNTIYSGYIYATSDQTSTIENNDNQAPTLFLSKETYIEGFDNWTLTNATIDNDGVLVLAETGTSAEALSPYFNVDGKKWNYTFDAYTTIESSSHTPKGGIYSESCYYDNNMKKIISNTGYDCNGIAPIMTLNTWTNSLSWNSMKWISATTDPNVKNIKIYFQTGNEYSQPITKIRNFKLTGQMYNSFYLINIESQDNIGISLTKYEIGEKEKSYFQTSGNIVTNNQIKVIQNGIYTIYTKDTSGNETISTIEITKIK